MSNTKQSHVLSNGSNLENELKRVISSPFGFQHIAHEGREQFPALRKLSHDGSVASILTKQSSWHATQSTNDVQEKGFISAFATPEVQGLGTSFTEQTPVNTSTSQPHATTIRQPMKFSNGMTPPPRSSSRNAVAGVNLTNSILDGGTANVYDRMNGSDATQKEKDILKRYNSRGHNRQFAPDMITTSVPRIMDLPHAVTTPDESAVPAASPSYSLDLDDVPEEGENYFFPRSSKSIMEGPLSESSISPQKSTKSLQSWGSRSTVSDSFSTPCSPVRYSTSRKRETGRPTLITSFAPDHMRRLSYQFKDLDCSWEDDIDFCYENAAEADCDFDWQSPSGYESCVDADLHGDVPFGSTFCNAQANGTAFISDTNSRADKGFATYPTQDPSERLPITSDPTEEERASPQSKCKPVSTNIGVGMTFSKSISNEVEDGSTSEFCLSIGKISPQLSTPHLLFSPEYNCQPKNAATSLSGLSGVEKATRPMSRVLETEKLGPFMSTPKISKTRLSRSSSFGSIIQPYSELPSSIRSSNGSFDYTSDLAKSRSNTIV